MKKTVKEIAEILNGEVLGDDSVIISGVSGLKEAKEGEITFVANPKYLSLLSKTNASAVIMSLDVAKSAKTIIRTQNPSLAFTKAISLFAPDEIRRPEGVHPNTVIGKNVTLGDGVSVQAFCVIEDDVQIGSGTILYAGVYVGQKTKIGQDCVIYPHVSIREKINIGNRVIIHNGTVIGSDGFGFAKLAGIHQKIPQIGIVIVEDDVEIGANVTIDRARFDKTVIGRGTKIDNLVQIAHNVIIGADSIVVAQAGISGTTTVGKNVVVAGQAGLVGHITIGDNAVIAAQAGVTKSVPAGGCVSGYPAKPHKIAKRVNACVQKLPNLFKQVTDLEKKIENLLKGKRKK